jgi:hypothetical protein
MTDAIPDPRSIWTTYDFALRYHRHGWRIAWTPPRVKHPVYGDWQKHVATELDIERWFKNTENGIFVVTGQASRLVVIDVDDAQADQWWLEHYPEIQETAQVQTSKGIHYYFEIPEGVAISNFQHRDADDDQGEWDVRGDGGGVVAPPSYHENGSQYRWRPGRSPKAIKTLSPGLQAFLAREATARAATGPLGGSPPGQTVAADTALEDLLRHPPQVGSRNMWLTQVAGHLAKRLQYEDAVSATLEAINRGLADPLDDDEIEKVSRSIWRREDAKDDTPIGVTVPDRTNGYLVSGGDHILVQTRTDGNYGFYQWLDADLRVLSVSVTDRDRLYEVEVRKPRDEITLDTLPSGALAREADLAKWLGRHGLSVDQPQNVYPRNPASYGARLGRYLEAQDAPEFEVTEALGWHEESGGFLTHDGLITAEGFGPFRRARPDRKLRNWSPHRYGMGDEVGARDALRTVLEFHEEDVVAVFGAWWAATFLKPQLLDSLSQFPFMALESPSGSGKSTGFFDMMMKLSGYETGTGQYTRAAARDALSANRSGIVWMDDLDSLEHYGEMLRESTVEGRLTKKMDDNTSQTGATLRGNLVVSGEGLSLDGQKALYDRAILLHFGSPTTRRSRRDPDRLQWDDIVDFRHRVPRPADYAGTLVKLALQFYERSKLDVRDLRDGEGRTADNRALLRYGVRLLRALTDTTDYDWLVWQVDHWAERGLRSDTGDENYLTLTLLPNILAFEPEVRRPVAVDASRKQPPTPAFVDDTGRMWFSPKLCAAWADWRSNRPIDPRTQSEAALSQQARRLGMGGHVGDRDAPRSLWRFATGNGKAVYWRVPDRIADRVMERSLGLADSTGQSLTTD